MKECTALYRQCCWGNDYDTHFIRSTGRGHSYEYNVHEYVPFVRIFLVHEYVPFVRNF